MAIITVNGLSMEFGEQKLFDKMYFEVQSGDRIGLIGVNGCGKTTLFKLLTGEYEPADGEIIINKNTKIGYMEQHVCRALDRSAYNEVLTVFDDLIEAERELERLSESISSKTGDIDSLVERQAFLNDEFTRREGLTYRARARSALLGLGFDDMQMQLPIRQKEQGRVQGHHGDPALDVAARGVVEQHGDAGDAAGNDARGPVEPQDGQGLEGHRPQGQEDVAALPPEKQLFLGLAQLDRPILSLEHVHGSSISKIPQKSTSFQAAEEGGFGRWRRATAILDFPLN